MKIQELVQEFCDKYYVDCKIENRILDVISEIGELSKEVLKSTDYGAIELNSCSEELTLEFGDVLFSLIALANKLDINMETALNLAMHKYEKRFQLRNSIGSL